MHSLQHRRREIDHTSSSLDPTTTDGGGGGVIAGNRTRSSLLHLPPHHLQVNDEDLDKHSSSSTLTGTNVNPGGGEGRNAAGAHLLASSSSHSRSAAGNFVGQDQRVEELFDLCERWRITAAVLPSVVERLKSLKSLHQEAGGISVRLAVLEEQQGELQSMLTTAEEHVDALQQTVKETVSWAKSTVEALQWRIKRLCNAQGIGEDSHLNSFHKEKKDLSSKEATFSIPPPPPLLSLSSSARTSSEIEAESKTSK